jgi:ketosteroid isomerase-like protein
MRIVVNCGGITVATNKEVIETAYAGFAKGDVPAVLAMMDPKIEWTEAEGFPIYSGTFGGSSGHR